ncbi:hypothetical protein OQJ40_12610 [Serratia nevei]|uniref:hypothetical protein n=1 Tax=Serratia nevei TaxID=2703794 RepID=UPI0027D2D5E7|nr:hypothetical protein [Serratia nevei]WMC77587.1 hypothetical protein O8I25_10735 [Serratia nevei]WMC83334.1 hypothetical protein O8I24_12605 [Serratia nevei]
MSTIIVKDALRASVEAASNGARTVLYTATGQPTYMSIFKKATWDALLPALSGNIATAGLAGKTHPAFIFGDKEADEIFIGTYASTRVNNEFLSLPYELATNIGGNVISSGYPALEPQSMLNSVYGQGKGFHPLSQAEHALIYATAKNNPAPAGSGNRVPNGANGALSNHNKTYNGVYGYTGAWSLPFGMRFVGDANNLNSGAELQFYAGMSNSLALLTDANELGNKFEGSSSWLALDVVTGKFVPTTHTGSLATADYTPTTPNSVRLFTSKAGTAPSIPGNGIWIKSGDGVWNYDPQQFVTTINASVIEKLRLFMALPSTRYSIATGGQIGTEPAVPWKKDVATFIHSGAYRWGDWMAMPWYEWAFAGASMRVAYVNPAKLK